MSKVTWHYIDADREGYRSACGTWEITPGERHQSGGYAKPEFWRLSCPRTIINLRCKTLRDAKKIAEAIEAGKPVTFEYTTAAGAKKAAKNLAGEQL